LKKLNSKRVKRGAGQFWTWGKFFFKKKALFFEAELKEEKASREATPFKIDAQNLFN